MSVYVRAKGELAKRIQNNTVVNYVVKHLKDLLQPSDLVELRLHNDLIGYICNIVESLVVQRKRQKFDKKVIVLNIMQKCINSLTDQDKSIINDQIEFLHGSHYIKKIKILKYLGHYGLIFLKYFIPIPKIM